MPGVGSFDESYTPSLIWHDPHLPLLPGSGVKEMYPAGTGLPLNVTFPDIWASFGSDEHPTAIIRTAASAEPASTTHASARLARRGRTVGPTGASARESGAYQSLREDLPSIGSHATCQVTGATDAVTPRTLPSASPAIMTLPCSAWSRR